MPPPSDRCLSYLTLLPGTPDVLTDYSPSDHTCRYPASRLRYGSYSC